MPPPAESSRRDVLISTATALFCQHGIHAVGIDWIIEEAGVAKATLYRHFPSKNNLIVAALRDASRGGLAALSAAVESASTHARSRFLALPAITALSTKHGCVFNLAAQEFPIRSHAVHKESVAHKRALRGLYGKLATEAGSDLSPEESGAQTQLVLDGIYAAVALGPADAKRAVPAAEQLLASLLDAS